MHGDPSLQDLPIEYERDKIQASMKKHRAIAVRAPAGNGKTMKLPEMMLDVLNEGNGRTTWPLVLVVPSIFGRDGGECFS